MKVALQGKANRRGDNTLPDTLLVDTILTGTSFSVPAGTIPTTACGLEARVYGWNGPLPGQAPNLTGDGVGFLYAENNIESSPDVDYRQDIEFSDRACYDGGGFWKAAAKSAASPDDGHRERLVELLRQEGIFP